MKKTDWISAFVTIALTGGGYFISGPKVALVCIVVGTIGTVLLHFFGNRSKEADDSATAKVSGPKTEIKDSFNPQQKQEFNPIFAPKIEIGTVPATPAPPLPTVQSTIPRRKPNVHFKSVRTCHLGIGDDAAGEFILREIDHDTGASGIVACYRNDPITGVRTASDVGAHLTLRDAEGREIGTGVSKACWLNNPNDTIDLESGIPQHVVLLVTDKEAVTVPWKHWKSPVLDSGFYTVPKPVASIEVEIIDSWGEPLLPKLTFSVSMQAGLLTAELKPPS